ncbi:hypothetical protein [Streptomyces sp. H27-D2]|uniref:hypothetical protein n=1 Tax=Streptomyces sp. H27-D2 TaxID=3046304 RepID=UPI002DB8AF65|nr:hypothetical protein [Streptomyces sp. H27-D2]MEC4020838.1 hypothetical protein [Streptomyces sp. H27-D2]
MRKTKERAERDEQESDALRAADAAVAELKEALARVGMSLPSLRAGMPVNGSGFVELGGCNAGAASRLAKIFNAAADALPELRATGP